MKSLVTIIEIPVTDFNRAVNFYKNVLNLPIEEFEMGGNQMGVIQAENELVNVCLVKGDGYQPSENGTIIYLNTEDDLQPILDRVESNGGKIIVPKSEISPDMGFYAILTDTEGNKTGLHSMQ